MPADDGLGMDDDEHLLPPRPEPAKCDPEDPIRRSDRGPLAGGEGGELLAERQVLEDEVTPRAERGNEDGEERAEDPEHAGVTILGGSRIRQQLLAGRVVARATTVVRSCRAKRAGSGGSASENILPIVTGQRGRRREHNPLRTPASRRSRREEA